MALIGGVEIVHVFEVMIEDYGVIMGTAEFFAVFSAVIEADIFPIFFTEAFEEFLEVGQL
jgi:hypothetical protein